MRENPLILLAEDNFASQRAAESMLHRLGYRVEIRDTGIAAVEACLSSPYDAVLMDGFMPEMDGFAAAREIRRRERGRPTPILALTAGGWDKDRQRCLDAGMDYCLSKPLAIELLSQALKRFHRPSSYQECTVNGRTRPVET
jgi:two-component system, sensor histidine kinase and response regulator